MYKKQNQEKSLFIKFKPENNQTNAFGIFLKENIKDIQVKCKNKPKQFFQVAYQIWKDLPSQ